MRTQNPGSFLDESRIDSGSAQGKVLDDFSLAEKRFSGAIASEFIGALNASDLSKLRAVCDSLRFYFCPLKE